MAHPQPSFARTATPTPSIRQNAGDPVRRDPIAALGHVAPGHARAPLTRRAFVAGAASLAAGAALGLAGCSVEEPLEPAPEPDGDSPAPTPEIESGVAGTLAAAVAYADGTPNPVGCASGLFLAANWHVFEGLYELNMHTYRAELGLAAADPVQIDDLSFEVSLRENAVFSDGTPLTVDDVVNAFTRNMADELYGAFLSFISGVAAKDETTVRFSLSAPMGSLLRERLALVRIFPASLTDEELAQRPLGSGPWCYESVNAADGGSIVFTPNRRYEGPYPATCNRMEWSVILDDEARTQALVDRRVLAMEAAPEVLTEDIVAAGASIDYVPGCELPFLMFNCARPPFDDVRVRQALLYALDVDSLIGEVMAGHARAATSLLPDYFRGYHRASTVYSYDPEKARKLLAEAGVEELALTLRVNDNWVSALAPLIVRDWKAVGVTAEVVPLDTAALFADISTPPEPATLLPFDVVLSPGDPSCFGNDPDLIMSWWYGDNTWTRARTCWAGTPQFDELAELMAQARATTEEGPQQELWNQCFDIIAAEAPLYPLFHREIATAYYDAQLDGYDPIGATGLLFLGTTPMKETSPI
ncbi:ABC transporter substrate-binding protein [uncultured Adlercreutzia sp.]|uniref:ABC transporter substrate-binding protein n=1 Tax=uncultured Adlercreutzia sp. TaxID=875803 RepID=UPI002676FFBD|nr:ABC transporter substrate-binding protein [uncultured Adlercreutzia sp.]